ncbi:unnamed protein product [Xylocopa violacea]|uniref:Uncharacterized protein n=1 Tax=Xylocopa violacea TaxID=135666 RepID=A0ABP1P686_XYLVO
MVKQRQRKITLSFSMTNRWTRKKDRKQRLEYRKALKKMLTSGRSGSVHPEEIGNGPDTKDPGTSEDGSKTYTRDACTPGVYENDNGMKEFLSTERTGRRNALTEYLRRQAETEELSSVSDRFDKLSVETGQSNSNRQDPNSPSTSKQQG